MHEDESLAALLDRWQDAQDRGEEVAPESLCEHTPDLIPELSRRIAVLRRFDLLRADADSATDAGETAQKDTHVERRRGGDTLDAAAAPSFRPDLGGEFGGYRIVVLLGEGGMGRVFKAVDVTLRREVALKVVKPEVAARPQARERFLREARAMAAVQHDHVAPIYQVGEVDGAPFLAMPLLHGEPILARLAREKVLAPAEVIRIGREIAEGLAAAHAKGLVHRDIKPANIWLEHIAPGLPGVQVTAPPASPGLYRVKLLDFGLARDEGGADGLTQEGIILGTPEYMSPEQVDGHTVDQRSDLFSLGSVLYECATGQRPFRAKTITAVLHAVGQRRPPSPDAVNPQVPRELAALIDTLLAKDPADRPPTAQAVADKLGTIESTQETTTYAGTGPHMPPPKSRRPWLWATAVFGVVLVGAVSYPVLKAVLKPKPADGPIEVVSPPPGVGDDKKDPPAAAPLSAKLRVFVGKRADPENALEVSKLGALPLREGDQMRAEVKTNRPAYVYVIYVDAQGEASPWFPWHNYDWDDRPKEQKINQLFLPSAEGGLKLTPGPSGIEAVLVLARDEPLTAAETQRLRNLFAQAPPRGKFDPLRAAVRLGTEEGFDNTADRGRPSLDATGTLVDPVERMRRLVLGDLKGLAEDVRGVCYPFQGR